MGPLAGIRIVELARGKRRKAVVVACSDRYTCEQTRALRGRTLKKQLTLAANDFERPRKPIRRQKFLAGRNTVVGTQFYEECRERRDLARGGIATTP